MLVTVLEWLTDFFTRAIMESRKAARWKAVASPPWSRGSWNSLQWSTDGLWRRFSLQCSGQSYMIFQFVFPWPVWLNCVQLGMVWKISDPCRIYISKLSVTVKMWWHHKWYNGRGSASVAVAEAPWTLPFDVRVLGWTECKFVLLFWVLYVTSPANFQKFVSRPSINITAEINALSVRISI